MKKVLFFIIFIFFISCGKVDEKTKESLAKNKDTAQKIKEKYLVKQKDFKEQAKSYRKEKKNINNKNKLFLSLKVRYYFMKHKVPPKNAGPLVNFIGKVPKEVFSGSNRISFKYDKKGGWFVNLKKQTVHFNFKI